MHLAGRIGSFRFFVRDRDAKFTAEFDDVLTSEGVRIVRLLRGPPGRIVMSNAGHAPYGPSTRTEC